MGSGDAVGWLMLEGVEGTNSGADPFKLDVAPCVKPVTYGQKDVPAPSKWRETMPYPFRIGSVESPSPRKTEYEHNHKFHPQSLYILSRRSIFTPSPSSGFSISLKAPTVLYASSKCACNVGRSRGSRLSEPSDLSTEICLHVSV